MTAALRPIEKEVRALLLPWLAAAVTIGAARAAANDPNRFVLLAYLGGAIVLGAWSVGHEYSGRTLWLLLSQPTARPRVLVTKVGVMAVMLAVLAILASPVLSPTDIAYSGGIANEPSLPAPVVPAVAGLFLALWVTLLTGSPMAGTVLTTAVMVAIWIAPQVASAFAFGPPSEATQAFASFAAIIRGRAFAVLAIIAACAGGLSFLRLEAIDGGARHVDLSAWPRQAATGSAVPSRRRAPLWQLVRKELHLQQLTFVVAGAYTLVSTIAWQAGRLNPGSPLTTVGLFTTLYCPLVALLIGALASAEERQYGTLEWQVLLPIAAWKQWMVKLGTVVILTGLCALALPMVFALLYPAGNELSFASAYLAVVLQAALVGLYVSSFSTSGVRALLVSILLMSAVTLLWIVTTVGISRFFGGANDGIVRFALEQAADPQLRALWWGRMALSTIVSIGIVVAICRLTFLNHRSAERGSGPIPRQAFWLAASVLVAVAAFSIMTGAINVRSRQIFLEMRTSKLSH